MPHETKWSARGVEWRYYGVVTADETRKTDNAFYSDPRSDTARYQLIDLRDVEELLFTLHEQEVSAGYDAAQSRSTPNVRVAFVVPDDRFDETLAVYMQILNNSTWRAKTFTSMEDARAWVGPEA